MSVEVEHHGSDYEQTTTLRATVEDATGKEHTHEFQGPPDGPYEYAGNGEPSAAALREVYDHVDDPDVVAHDHPDDGDEGDE